jgi:HSP20 family protein
MKKQFVAGLLMSSLARGKGFLPNAIAAPRSLIAPRGLLFDRYSTSVPAWRSRAGSSSASSPNELGRSSRDTSLKPFFGRNNDDLFSVFDDLDSFIPAFVGRSSPLSSAGSSNRPSRMFMDFKETPASYECIVDLPGVESKDIDVKLRDNQLTVSAHREGTKKEDHADYHRVERFSGHITRTITLPEDSDSDAITAENKNGVLHITIKKQPSLSPTEKKIEIKTSSTPHTDVETKK